MCADYITNEKPWLDLAKIQPKEEILHFIFRILQFLKTQVFLKVNDSPYLVFPRQPVGEQWSIKVF